MNTWTIYMYTFPNEKRYIGKTKRRLSQRQGNTTTWSGYKRCTLLWKAIQKYGVENIKQNILIKEKMSDDRACELEKQFIKEFKTNQKEFGYNLTDGGDGVKNVRYSEEELQRHIEQMRQNGLNHKGKPLSEEHKKKLSEAKKGAKNRLYGKSLPVETKKKISIANSIENISEETRRKKSEAHKKQIIAKHISDAVTITFKSMEEASNYFCVAQATITRWCQKKRKPSVPYVFNYCSANND